ncbi:MAG TPA: hypothetical protein PKA53_07885 [Sphingobacterium sp.]|nr:hypothetical protein [Sphingobacterium sp.]
MEKKTLYDLSEEELALITLYLHERLDHDARVTFEQRLASDPIWSQKVAETRLLILGIREANLASDIAVWHKKAAEEQEKKLKPIRPFYLRWWAIAGVAVLLSAVGLLWPKRKGHEALYHAYFEPDMGLPVEMGASDSSKYTFYDGMISYKEGNFADALAKWGTLTQNDTLHYFSGIAHMGLGDIAKAKDRLQQVTNEHRSVFNEDARWYLALCYLHERQEKNAIAQLTYIPHQKRANKLLNKLE